MKLPPNWRDGTCSTCVHYKPHAIPSHDGQCHRFPPRTMTIHSDGEQHVGEVRVPPTLVACGEFHPVS